MINLRKIAFLADYVPRQCGIATFTNDLFLAVREQSLQSECIVVAVNDPDRRYQYPEEVRFEIEEQDLSSYQRAADFLNFNNTDIVSLQHEFGIYGGVEGSYILGLLRNLHVPVVTTLHTILDEPNADQRRVMRDLVALSTRLVCMTEKGKIFLREIYNVPDEKIDVIPHGIPDMPFVDPNFYKDQFGVEGKYVLLTFGLLSPNKGIECVLKALPKIIKEFPNLVYIVLGATHPSILLHQGESYRMSLERMAHDLGIKHYVIFYNRFVELDELKEFLGAADIYITPYLNRAQITSGTLSYAFGCGKAVISTPYWHAEELLSEERGVLVPFSDPEAIAREVIALLRDEPRRHAMRKKAYMLGRDMIWSNVAHLYMKTFMKARSDHPIRLSRSFAVRTLNEQKRQLPAIRLDHLMRMSDSTGLLQHAIFSIPRFEDGYCTDDNARAFLLTVLLQEIGLESVQLNNLAKIYAAFLNHAFNTERNRFRNFMGFDRRWLEEVGSEDSHARALWALGACVGHSKQRPLQMWAVQLFEKALPVITDFTSPRAWAFGLIGIHEYLRQLSGDRTVNQIRDTLTQRLIELYEQTATDDWEWFEDVLSYDNAKLAHALILSGQWMPNERALEIGLRSLKWLLDVQTAENGHFRPIGSNGWYTRGGNRAQFDQQPVITYSCMSACLEAYRTTGDNFWLDKARVTFEWFLGRNDLGLALYDPNTGGCYDALHVDRLNQNQGAESTLAWLLALTEMHSMEQELNAFDKPAKSERQEAKPIQEKQNSGG
ncbi:MAG: glycosyltransferase family 4 protein [Calditrichia bacterium]